METTRLLTCPECGTVASADALLCLNCGHQFRQPFTLPEHQPQRKKTDLWAGLSAAAALVACAPVAVVLGVVSLVRQQNDSALGGQAWAILGLAGGLLEMAFFFYLR